MKLINHVLDIRKLVQQAMDNRFSKMGIKESGLTPIDALPEDLRPKRQKLEDILNNHQSELEDYAKARQETINECTFTLFNRIAAIKVMEEKELFPEVIKRRPENGNKSFSHNLWLEENPSEKNAERQGLKHFLQSKFNELGENFPLYNENYPYSLMPTADELFNILEAFNAVENDPDCGADIWKGDDILGWLYENFNAVEKEALKDSGEKTEYDKVSLQSQVYTPRWVVKFLVDNTLGKYYLEMFPDSDLVKPDENGDVKYKIANAPTSRKREPKKMEEIRVIDPACGSGNFLIYTFDLLYDMYLNQMEQYDADYSRRDIPRLILENNIYGVDLDERAVQLSQIALFIKSRELGGRRAKTASHTNVVSTHFFLPDYSEVESEFIASGEWDQAQRGTIRKIWSDLQNAHKFGSLVRVEEVLNGLSLKEDEGTLFATEMEQDLFSFKRRVTDVLHDQVKNYCEKNTSEYALTKAEDAMTFLSILSMPFDVVVANPPYTDSGDFGSVLKEFIDNNYRRPYSFNSNLFASFIKRTYELSSETGKVGIIHPSSFMFIRTFEDVRAFILDNTHINILVDYGLDRVNLFGPGILLDAAFYTLEKRIKKDSKNEEDSIFINCSDNLQEKYKKGVLEGALKDIIAGIENKRVFSLSQGKLKGIDSYPFIYWISDEFRKKFDSLVIGDAAPAKVGMNSGGNERFLRFHWELSNTDNWKSYSKGGPYNRWYGNYWVLMNWENDGYDVKHAPKSILRNQDFYFKEGITYSACGGKGLSFRYLPKDSLFDVGGSCIFPKNKTQIPYVLAFLNSKLCTYIANCLNPTVNIQVGDLNRIPFVLASKDIYDKVTALATECIEIKKNLCQYSIIEQDFKRSPIGTQGTIAGEIQRYFNKENALLSYILIVESIINDYIFRVYQLSETDKQKVLEKEGIPCGDYPVSRVSKEAFLNWLSSEESLFHNQEVINYVENLPESDSIPELNDLQLLYQTNNGVEEYCENNHVNPIVLWYYFKLQGVSPVQRTKSLVFELITDAIRTALSIDDDGIIPLVDKSGEEKLEMRIEAELISRGYNAGQISQLIQLLGIPLDRYLRDEFFHQLSDSLNLFMYLPKTPFIWHITSGPHHAMELFVSIYKWDRNSLFRIKSIYSANRETALKDRLSSLSSDDPSSQMEAGIIKDQLEELRRFNLKIDDLLSTGYSPRVEDGVGKNIAPLQVRNMISYQVLKDTQLKKYLKADW